MAGTLTISTLSDGTNSTSATNCIQGSAKAWITFNGSSAAIRASYNFSSVTRNGTGDYTATFTNAMTDTNYCATGGAGWGVVAPKVVLSVREGSILTTSVRFDVFDMGATNNDSGYVYLEINR